MAYESSEGYYRRVYMKLEYKGYVINKTSEIYYCKILTNRGIKLFKDESLEQLKAKLDKYLNK